MNRNYFQKGTIALLLLSASLMNAQDLGLVSGGNKVLNELVRAFPIIAGIAFLWVAWDSLSTYRDTKDALQSMKGIGWWLLSVLFVVGVYQVVKNISL